MENFRHKLFQKVTVKWKQRKLNRTCCTILETLTFNVTPCQNTLVTKMLFASESTLPQTIFCHSSDWAKNISSSGFFRCLRAFVYHIRDSQKHSQSWSFLYVLLSPEFKLIYNQFILEESAWEEHIASSQRLILSSSYFKLTQSCLLNLL